MHSYYVEYDTSRVGGFEPMQHLPRNENVISGVITSKFAEVEDVGEMEIGCGVW